MVDHRVVLVGEFDDFQDESLGEKESLVSRFFCLVFGRVSAISQLFDEHLLANLDRTSILFIKLFLCLLLLRFLDLIGLRVFLIVTIFFFSCAVARQHHEQSK